MLAGIRNQSFNHVPMSPADRTRYLLDSVQSICSAVGVTGTEEEENALYERTTSRTKLDSVASDLADDRTMTTEKSDQEHMDTDTQSKRLGADWINIAGEGEVPQFVYIGTYFGNGWIRIIVSAETYHLQEDVLKREIRTSCTISPRWRSQMASI